MLTQKLLGVALVGTEWIIWLLLLLSVYSVGRILEGLIVLRRKSGDTEFLKDRLDTALRKESGGGIETILRNDGSSAAKVSLQTIQTMKGMGLDFEDSLSVALSQERLNLEKPITILGTLGSNAPFVGLFGTVLGIIHAFHSLAENTKGGPTVVMAGISEALVATALGLFVAIPAVAAYNYFVKCIKKIMVGSENLARLVVVTYMNASGSKR